jgi:hypothetical protein
VIPAISYFFKPLFNEGSEQEMASSRLFAESAVKPNADAI